MKRLLSICILLIASVLTPMAPAHADAISTLLNADLGPIVLPPSHPRLSAAQQQVGADWTIANGYTGQGVSVVLMDGGIQSDHVQFDGRIIAEVCTQPAVIVDIIWKCKSDAGISEGTGTAEAGLDANGNPVWHGVGVSSSVLEFAPSVRLIMIKNGDALQGFDWIIANAKKYNIAAASMSFGNDGPSPRQTDYCNVPDWHQRFVAMRALGVIPVAATGNGGQLTGISHPACDPLVVSVGAVTPDDKIVSYSNISDRTTLLAPTEFETADTTSDKTKKDAWRDIFSGTSAATPVVAAMMAIGKSVAPNASVDDIVSAARATGKSIDDVAVKDLRRVNFDKFVSNLLNIKPIPTIKSLSTSNPTKTSTTLTWTVENTPSHVRVTPGDQPSQLFDGKDGSIKIQKVARSHTISVKIEALQADGTVTSTKNINVGFFIDGVTGWCNPTGNELAIDAPLMGHFEVLGPNKENPNLVDFGVGLQGIHLSCTYIEMSPLSTPEIAYIARLKASNSPDRHTIVIPKSFGNGGVIRVTNIDMDGNYSRIYSHIFSEGSFDLASSNGYEAELA
ncbi:MAG: S8 family peptidase, partial [Candidatus Planktophila sp.]